MAYIINPLLEEMLQLKEDVKFEIVDSDTGEKVDLAASFESLEKSINSKLDSEQGVNRANKVLTTDAKGSVQFSQGLLMSNSERAKLAELDSSRLITQAERDKISKITDVLVLRGVLDSVDKLNSVPKRDIGDCYYITDQTGDTISYTQYVWSGSDWAILDKSKTPLVYSAGEAVSIINDVISILTDNKTIRIADNRLYVPTDTEPTENSDNFVSSGAVYNALRAYKKASGNFLPVTDDLDNYPKIEGEIVKYTGENGKYTKGYNYICKKTETTIENADEDKVYIISGSGLEYKAKFDSVFGKELRIGKYCLSQLHYLVNGVEVYYGVWFFENLDYIFGKKNKVIKDRYQIGSLSPIELDCSFRYDVSAFSESFYIRPKYIYLDEGDIYKPIPDVKSIKLQPDVYVTDSGVTIYDSKMEQNGKRLVLVLENNTFTQFWADVREKEIPPMSSYVLDWELSLSQPTGSEAAIPSRLLSDNGQSSVLASDEEVFVNAERSNFSGDVVVQKNLIVKGETIEQAIQVVNSENDFIELRKNNVMPLADGEVSGFEVQNYDGNGSKLRLVVDNKGVARVGDVGDEEPLATRAEDGSLTDGAFMIWNASKKRLETISRAEILPLVVDVKTKADLGKMFNAGLCQEGCLYATYEEGKSFND